MRRLGFRESCKSDRGDNFQELTLLLTHYSGIWASGEHLNISKQRMNMFSPTMVAL